jgi:hypothetical protein
MSQVNLQKNEALHYLAMCFLLQLRLNFKFKYKVNDAKEKINNYWRFLNNLNLSIHAKKGPYRSREALPLSDQVPVITDL